jgi:hypothetical protein
VLLVAGPVVSVLKALSWAPASSCSTPCCTRTP